MTEVRLSTSDTIGVFQVEGWRRVAHIATAAGARTSLFVPELDQLLLALRANGRKSASIWVFRPGLWRQAMTRGNTLTVKVGAATSRWRWSWAAPQHGL